MLAAGICSPAHARPGGFIVKGLPRDTTTVPPAGPSNPIKKICQVTHAPIRRTLLSFYYQAQWLYVRSAHLTSRWAWLITPGGLRLYSQRHSRRAWDCGRLLHRNIAVRPVPQSWGNNFGKGVGTGRFGGEHNLSHFG
jgi:hypothetical protein